MQVTIVNKVLIGKTSGAIIRIKQEVMHVEKTYILNVNNSVVMNKK